MSREWVGAKRSEGWQMRCDNWDGGCRVRSDIRPTTEALPLEEFAAAGWYVAATHGDRCPSCVAAAGGMAALLLVRTYGHANSPNSVMDAIA
jgi:hypothetical protein